VGRFGDGPFDFDAAVDLRADLRSFFGNLFHRLGDDDTTAHELDVANDAARILGALSRESIDLRPDDVQAAKLAPDARAALHAEAADARSGFAGEPALARTLREAGAPYRMWIGADVLGETARTIWAGAQSIREIIPAALGAGVPRATVICVISDWVREQLAETEARTRTVLDSIVAGVRVDDATRTWLHERMLRAVMASRRKDPSFDKRDLVIAIVEGLACDRLPWLPMRFAFVRSGYPDIAELIRARLEPHVAAVL
jgi:hypothetical protein